MYICGVCSEIRKQNIMKNIIKMLRQDISHFSAMATYLNY